MPYKIDYRTLKKGDTMTQKAVAKPDPRALLQTLTDALVDEWLEWEELLNSASENTVKTYRRSIRHFIKWLRASGVAAGSISPLEVGEFKKDQGSQHSAQTVNLRLTAVRRFYAWAVTTGKMPSNPAREVKGLKRKKSRSHKRAALTNGEVIRALDTCDTGTLGGVRDLAILSLLAYCGLRTVEIRRANVGDLVTRGDRLTLDIHGKGHSDDDEYAIIPRHQEPVIRAWYRHRMTFKDAGKDAPLFVSLTRGRGERLSTRSIRRMVKARFESAGVVGATKTTHSLRHSAITNIIRRGGTPLQAQAFARHASFDTTLGYYHEVARLDNPAEDLISYENGG
jgi:site-specific recombinase XerD